MIDEKLATLVAPTRLQIMFPDASDEFLQEISATFMMAALMGIEPTPEPTPREEANVIAAFCFRNTILEDVHVGEVELDDSTMKELMICSSTLLKDWLSMRDALRGKNELIYNLLVNTYQKMYTSEWQK